LVILVAGPFMLILIGMCVSLMKSLREEQFESTMETRTRQAWQHAQRFPDGP
jgi:choline-glycine betaine transporter